MADAVQYRIMKEKATLYEYVYRHLAGDIERGTLRYGDKLPSMHDLCERYRVGIRTIRDVQKALKAEGYIVVEERKRAVVVYRPPDGIDDRGIRSLLARRDAVSDCYRTLELVMPSLFFLSARSCSDEDLHGFARDAARVESGQRAEDWRLSRSSAVLHGLLEKTGNPLFASCYASLERMARVPVIAEFDSPFSCRPVAEVDGGVLSWMLASLELRDADEVQRRFGLMYRGAGACVDAYLDELEAAYPPAAKEGESSSYAWNAKAGLEFVHGQIARRLVERITRGEFADGQMLPSIADLSAAYGVSHSTVQKAYGMLNAIGIAQTVNGLGTRVHLGSASFPAHWLEDISFRRDVGTYVHALQMLCAVLPPALSATAPHIDAVADAVQRVLAGEEGDWAVSKSLLVGFIGCVEPVALRTILQELNDLLLWGRFFILFAASKASADALLSLAHAAYGQACAGDAEGFSRSMTSYYRLMLQAVLAFLEKAGMMEAELVLIP
ncbi:GntR family transcriptional regulator [Eggerthella guodeyinii]|nr:GntR family transcriptional regulator [Eggerthella guodeyinii]